MINLKDLYDVNQLLKRFGTIIYVGDKKAELDLIEDELKALFQNQLITKDQYLKGLMIINKEKNRL